MKALLRNIQSDLAWVPARLVGASRPHRTGRGGADGCAVLRCFGARLRRAVAHALLALLVVLSAASVFAAELSCDRCGQEIRGRYLKSGDDTFCSKACYLKSLPRCATCGDPIQGHHLSHDHKVYCSKKCFEASLPKCAICGKPLRNAYRIDGRVYCEKHANGPRCEACGIPIRDGKVLMDGRHVCSACHPTLILEHSEAEDLYYKSAATLRHIVGKDLPIVPPMHLAGRDELPSHDELDDGISVAESGRYVRHTETTTVSFFGKVLREEKEVDKKIVMLYGLTREQFLSTAAHELMHDIVSEQYPAFDKRAPDGVEEGVCQYAAALVCRRLGLRAKLHDIETSDHPIYGGGYRYIADRFGTDNWEAVARWMAAGAFDSLPASPP